MVYRNRWDERVKIYIFWPIIDVAEKSIKETQREKRKRKKNREKERERHIYP